MVFTLASAAPWYSLSGHMVYGAVTGLVFGWVGFRSVMARTAAAPA